MVPERQAVEKTAHEEFLSQATSDGDKSSVAHLLEVGLTGPNDSGAGKPGGALMR